MLVLELLGAVSLRSTTGEVPLEAQQKRRLGLLAVLAIAGTQGLSRDRVEAYLWPESAEPAARHALEQAVYAVRRTLGSDVILSMGRQLRLNQECVVTDVSEFKAAIRAAQWETAVDRYRGPLLDGFHIADSRELETWVDAERARLSGDYRAALGQLAKLAAEAADHLASVVWLRRLASSDPLSAGPAKQLMLALVAAGDRAGAVKHGRVYTQLVRQELEIEPDADIERLIGSLGQSASADPGVSSSVANPARSRTVARERSSESTHSHPLAPPTAERAHARTNAGSGERTVLYAVVPLAILVSGAAIWEWVRPAPSKAVLRYALTVDSTQAIVRGEEWSGRLALSPDGSLLAYIGGPNAELLVRPRNRLGATVVPGTAGVSTPFFSPDGAHVGFLKEEKVRIIPVEGGPPVAVTDTLTGVAGASWGRDGFIYTDGSGPTALLRVEAKAGAKPKWFTVLDSAKGEFDHTWPDVLPNGKGVLFTVASHRGDGASATTTYAIAVADIPSGRHRVIVNNAMHARYASSGHLLYVTTNRTLMVVPFDASAMKITGQPTAISEGVRLGLLGAADLAVSATGTLVYATGSSPTAQEAVWVTRGGKTQFVDSNWSATYVRDPAISPDGKWLALVTGVSAEPWNIWVKRVDGGSRARFTFERGYNVNPQWTPDGRSLTYSSDAATGTSSLWYKRADGRLQPVFLFGEKRNLYRPLWSPDHKWVVFQTDPAQAGAGDILGIRPGVDTVPTRLVATQFTEVAPALSPDGLWLAYVSNESGQFEVYVVPFPNTDAGRWAISSAGGTEPVWSHRQSELFFRDAAGNLVSVEVRTSPTFAVGRSRVLFPASVFFSYQFGPQYAVAADDRRFLMIRSKGTGTPDKLIVVENWFEELMAKPRE